MNKGILVGITLLVGVVAAKAEYNALQLTYDDESQQIINIEGLKVTPSEETLVFTNADGVAEVELSRLVEMEFVDYNVTAIADIWDDTAVQGVTVYDLDGKLCGQFESVAQMISELHNGVYVIRASNGKTLKIAIRK